MSPATVLVVEDNSITRKMFRVALAASDYRVLEAESGRQALDLAEQEAPDLVLLDLQLPDIDGIDVARQLRRTRVGASVPIVAVSGFLSKMEQAQSAQIGFTDFLFKPVEPSRLLERIEALLSRRMVNAKVGEGRLILVVDDDPVQLKLLKIRFETLGFRVMTAADGADAIERAKVACPDAIVSDVLMSRMDGFTLCQTVRQTSDLASVPVVLISGIYTDEADRTLAAAAGANAFLANSPDFSELSAVLLDCLQRATPAPKASSLPLPLDAYFQRTIQQLERQVHLNKHLTNRVAHLEGELSIVAGLAVSTASNATLVEILQATLGRCLSTARLSAGVIYGFDEHDGLSVRAQIGYSKDDQESLAGCFGLAEFFLDATKKNEPILLPSAPVPDDLAGEILTKLGAESMVLAPLVVANDREGLLMAVSPDKEIESSIVQFISLCGNHAAQAMRLSRVNAERQRLEEQFRQSQKLEAVGRLAGGIAHDFNNLLTAILGYCDLIVQQLPESDQCRTDLEEIRKAGNSAAALTRQILAFSRRQILEPVVLDLNGVITNLDRMLRRLIGEDVTVVTRLNPDLGRVKVDAGQIEQIILNLVVNARDAMTGGGMLTVETANATLDEDYARTHAGATPGEYVMLAVSDTGHGMDAYTQSRLFEPFFTTKEQGKGTGLGLASVYGIVKQSGGSIWVYSEPGRGTTLRIYLPRVESVAAPLSKARRPTRPAVGAETVLVVEDHDGLRALARKILERHGYRVLAAQDANEALSISAGHEGPIHLLLTDVVLPGISGPGLVERLGPRRPQMKLLYTSGYADDAIMQHGILASGTAFLAKPYTAETLTHKVRQVLDAMP